MKYKTLQGLLAIEAAICILLCFLKVSLADVFSSVIAFPFEQIGIGLRALSLSGGFGNVVAIMIYIFISLLPIGILIVLKQKRRLFLEDWLLALLSAVLFGVLYLMINLGFISQMFVLTEAMPIGKAMLGSMVYSLLFGYLILKVLRLFSGGNLQKLECYMAVMLGVLNVLFVFLAFGACFSDMLDSISSLQAGNSGNEHLLGGSLIFLVLQYAVNALPYVLDVFVVFAALRLLSEMRKDRYSSETTLAAEHMSRLCALALTITTLSNIILNLLQFLFAKWIMVINSSVQIPIMSLLFVLAALLLTRFITENKQLKDENDKFI